MTSGPYGRRMAVCQDTPSDSDGTRNLEQACQAVSQSNDVRYENPATSGPLTFRTNWQIQLFLGKLLAQIPTQSEELPRAHFGTFLARSSRP
jgi:hypothetical protein